MSGKYSVGDIVALKSAYLGKGKGALGVVVASPASTPFGQSEYHVKVAWIDSKKVYSENSDVLEVSKVSPYENKLLTNNIFENGLDFLEHF